MQWGLWLWMVNCLWVRGGRARVGEPCQDLGEYRSISCSFNALVFIIHGFSSTLNGITWLLCGPSCGKRRDFDLEAGFTMPALQSCERSVSPNLASD